jgi:putative OPT family oligopeptide transporter
MIGAVVCCAACVAGDNLQDLKAGYLVGATPWRQQVMLAVGSVSCALIMSWVLNVLAVSYGIGPRTPEHPQSLEAAQANLMASVAKGMFGGHLPWGMIAIGGAIGVAIIILDQVLKARGAKFRVPVLAAAIGIYLPLETDGADFHRRPAQLPRDTHFREGPVGRRNREAQSQGHAVCGRSDYG